MQEVQQPLQVQLTCDMLKLTNILVWGVGFISCNALSQIEKDDDLGKGIQASKVVYVKPLRLHRMLGIHSMGKCHNNCGNLSNEHGYFL